MNTTKVISVDVTPNGKCFQIEYKSDIGAIYSTNFDVVSFKTIENAVYDLSDARITSSALNALVDMNSRHLL